MPPFQLRKCGPRLVAATSLLLVLFSSAAYAVDGNAVGARLKAVYAEQGGLIDYKSVETNGSTVILKDAKVSASGVKESFDVGDITLNDVSDVSGGGFKIGELTMPDINFTPEGQTDGKIVVDGMKLEGITLPAEGATDPLAKILHYEKAEIKHIGVNSKGKDIFVADGITATISPVTETSPVSFNTNINSFKLDLSDAGDPKTREALKALGYETVSGKIVMNGSWNVSDGRLHFDKMDFVADNAGTLGVTFDISGYTLDFIKGMQEAVRDADGKTEDARNMAMLGLMQQLNFTSASVRFDDDSVTNKALDYVAKQQGSKRSELIGQAKMILPIAAAQLGNADFAQALGKAVNTYLDDPKTIEIKAAPDKPVPFAIIAAGGMADPKSLIKTLGVTVSANQ